MNFNPIFNNIFYCGAIASGIFFIMILIISRTGVFEEVRNEEGHFRKNISWKGRIGFAFFFGLILSLLWWSNRSLLSAMPATSFSELWLNCFGTFFLVHLFDLLILDWLIVFWWHPDFLNMPETDYYTKLKPHWDGFLRGIPFGVLVSLIVTGISYYLTSA